MLIVALQTVFRFRYVCVCVWIKFGEYGITSWKHEERIHDSKYNINFGVVGYYVHAEQTSNSCGRTIVQGMSMFDRKKYKQLYLDDS